MEQHPIPRNITGFQFHLVGDMTLKQFGYLAGGVILAYFVYKLPFPSLITIPLAGTAALLGAAFAFLPIQDRPLDRWLVAFIKSIYSPTQYLWRKDNPPLNLLLSPIHINVTQMTPVLKANHQITEDRLRTYLRSIPPTLDATITTQEKAYIQKTLSLFDAALLFHPAQNPKPATIIDNKPQPPPSVETGEKITFSKATPLAAKPFKKDTAPLPEKSPEKKIQAKEKDKTQEETLKKEADELRHELQSQTLTQEKFLSLESKLNELLREKERLTEELIRLKQQPAKDLSVAVKPIEVRSDVQKPTVKKLNPQTVKDVTGMPSIPNVPNLVLGVVRDTVGRLLPGIIVTVKDLSGMPQRAIKTNKLGQFASATPLQNGEYLFEVEDPQKRYTFDIIDITLNGQIFMPIEIIAKGQREIMRDKLTKELFGQVTM